MRHSQYPDLTDENTEEKQVALGHPALKWQKWNAHFSAQVHGAFHCVLREKGLESNMKKQPA